MSNEKWFYGNFLALGIRTIKCSLTERLFANKQFNFITVLKIFMTQFARFFTLSLQKIKINTLTVEREQESLTESLAAKQN